MKTSIEKIIIYRTLCFLLVSCFCALNLLLAQKVKRPISILANVNETIITPPVGTYLLEPEGKASTGIHDELFARSLTLNDGINTIVIVTLDLVGLDPRLVANIRSEVQKQTGIKPENLMLNTTHSHNTPITINYNNPLQRHRDINWESQLVIKITQSVISARSNLIPVLVFTGRDSVKIGFNRRPHGGPLVPWVDVLEVKNKMNNKPLAIFFSHAAHPVNVHVSSTEINSDYPGYAVRKVNEFYNNQTVSMFAQACGGNILSSPLAGGYPAAEKAGNMLGYAVINALKKPFPVTADLFHIMFDTIYLPYEDIELETAGNLLSEILSSEENIKDENSNLNRWAKNMVKYSRGESFIKGQPMEIQAFSFNKDFAIIALNHEVLAEYQLFLTKYSPFKHTIVLAYTNVTDTYIPTDEALSIGGYEPISAPELYGVLPLKPGCERILKEKCLSILTQLKSLYSDETN
jgi:neutral ceramidase